MNIQALLKQAQQMQSNITKIEKELELNNYSATAGGDLVKVVVNGAVKVNEVQINEELLSKDNKEELQDLIMIATNAALLAAKEDRDLKMNKVTQGVKVPGMM